MRMRALGVMVAVVLVCAGGASSHPGDTDQYGGHTDRKTGVYHVHGCLVAGNKRSRIYHLPGGQFSRQMATTSQNKVCFGSEADAERAGYRKSKR